MRKILILISFIFVIGFSLACDDGCVFGTGCVEYGGVVTQGVLNYYCDFNVDGSEMALFRQKPYDNNEECLNDFECIDEYSCLDGICTNAYNYFIQGYNALLANLSGICMGEEWFCSNTTSLINATVLGKDCSFSGPDAICYSCNSPFYYNNSIGKCISGICSSPYKCLNISLLENASINSDYCAEDKKCFNCDDGYEWNGTAIQCRVEDCSSSPGCSNQTDIMNGVIVSHKYCESGSCWACKPCYYWNRTSSSCVYSSSCSTFGVNWTDVVFTSSEMSSDIYKLLNTYDRINFSFESRPYRLEVLGIDNAKIVFKLYPNMMTSGYNLFAGNNAQFDLNGDVVKDLQVSLAGISDGRANVSIKFLSIRDYDSPGIVASGGSSPEPDIGGDYSGPNNLDLGSSESRGFFGRNIWWLIVIGVIIIGLLTWLIIYLINKPKNGSNNNTQVVQQQPPVKPVNPYGSYPVGGYRPMQV